MNKRRMIYCIFFMMFAGIFSVFSVSAASNNVAQGITITEHRPADPNSEFAGSSFSTSSEKFSMPSFSLSKKKGEFSRHSSIAKDSSFSGKSSLGSKSGRSEFSKASFSIHDDAEFSSSPSSVPKSSRSEFSDILSSSSREFSSSR